LLWTGSRSGRPFSANITHAFRHIHSSDESGIVLEGKIINEKETEIMEGMYLFISASVEHGPMNVPDGCVLLVHSSGHK
jgi:quercetin dioxygenase-like cupin family protein